MLVIRVQWVWMLLITLFMNANHIVLYLLPLVASVFVWASAPLFSRTKPDVVVVEEFQPLEEPVLAAKPILQEEVPRLVKLPVAIEEPKQPVQSLEERGDAMLFESDALFGTPFDQATMMPFD